MSRASHVPAGYQTVQAYLILSDAHAAIDFYVRALNATERMRMRRADGTIAHAELLFGESCVMLADENAEIAAYSPAHFGGSPVSLMLYVEDCDASYRRALAAGATGTREPADQPYGDRTAGILDPFGYHWYFATHLADLSKEELEALQV